MNIVQIFYLAIILLILGTIISIITSPIFWIIVGIIVVGAIIAACNDDTTSTQQTRKSSYSEWSSSTTPSKPTSTNQHFDLDEEIETSELIKVRNVLNSFDFRKAFTTESKESLISMLANTGSSEFTSSFAQEIRGLDLKTSKKFFADFKKALNSEDLEDYDTITPRELLAYFMPEEELERKVAELNGEDEEDYDEGDNVATVTTVSSYDRAKQDRINKLRKEVAKLDSEYKFERGFEPDWDEDEHLSSKYKGIDEEKYLKARKEELLQKNIAYDYYLTPEERSEDDDGVW